MSDHGDSPTCVSAEPHGPTSDSPRAIADLAAHYFGCIKISERAHFLDRNLNSQLWNHELDVQLDKLLYQEEPDMHADINIEANNRVDEKIKGLALKIETQYKRTDVLRKALSEVKCLVCTAPKNPSENPPCNLVNVAGHSHKEWKDSVSYKDGIKIIHEWRQRKNENENTTNGNDGLKHLASDSEDMPTGRKQVREIIKKYHTNVDYEFEEDDTYELERDTNGYIIQWEVLGSSSTTCSKDQELSRKGDSASKDRPSSIGQHPSFYKTSSAPEKYLKPVSESATAYRFKGVFPDQRISLKDLLLYTSMKDESKQGKEERDVILCRKRHEKEPRVRYIHIPHNNMKWVEEAIARYYDEESQTHDGIYRSPQRKTHSQMVLRPQYWRGQQHGGQRTLVHARHMRAICERISSNIWELEDNPDNIVLFMPFLHWEEDRKRDKIAKVIDQATVKNRKEREEARNNAKSQRVSERTYRNLLPAKPQRSLQTPKKVDETHSQKIRSVWEEKSFGRPDVKHARNFLEFAGGFIREGTIEDERVKDGQKVWRVAKLPCDKHGRLRTQNKLGQFLLDAARLYEAMSIYRDQKLVETFLHHDPPLHPRRTLDQSYYWTLKSTKIRDMDQVVYRGTTMDYRDIHRLKVQDDCKGQRHTWHLSNLLNRKKCESVEAPERSEPENSMGVYRWDGHWVKADDIDDIACDHCRGEIRKVSRIVMVDQLWMWILDRQTILTSFPRRYGTNKSDPSGVHNSIRTRIRNARKNQIRSVFDVALIILDECSNTFFDRTKTKDRHPQVLDIFAESIGNLHLWHWTEGASKIYNSKSKYENTAHLHIAPLLNINPEGKLQREVRDIIDELDIMLHVIKEQKEVIKRFVKNVESIYDPCGTWRDEAPSPDGERDYQRSRSMPMSGLNKEKLERQKEEFMWFRKQAYDLISDAGDRIAELEGLRKSAESTSQGIKDLLDLKQQQASILQAWQSVRQADESVRQGRSVMIFTIVTIIFLPLSFMSSVFGMNNRDIGETNMSFGDQAAYMFPISASVILVSIIFAFWTYPRTLLWAAYKYAETWVLVTSGIYDVFLGLKDWKTLHMTSEDLFKSLEKSVEEMKSKVKSRRTKSAGEDCQDSHSSDETVTGNAAHENFPKSISSTDERLQSSGSYC